MVKKMTIRKGPARMQKGREKNNLGGGLYARRQKGWKPQRREAG